jgi:diacylglycerol O-acyltransferase / wax synthase
VEQRPLSDEDRAILDLEGPTVAGHTCKVIRLAAPAPTVEGLRERVAERIGEAPQLRTRLGGEPDRPAWVEDTDFEVARHVQPWERRVDSSELAGVVAELFERRLDRGRALWRIDVVDLGAEGAALVWRLHHALADGTAAMRFARVLLWDRVAGSKTSSPAPEARARAPAVPTDHDADEQRRRGHLAALIKRELAESIHRSPFDGRIGARRRVAMASAPFRPLHDAAKRLAGATVNDAVLAVVAGGLRGWIERHQGRLEPVRFRVPVSLHSEGDHAGNRDSFFTLPVHLEEADVEARLRAIHAATAKRKADHDAERLDSMLRRLHAEAPPLAGFADRIESSPRNFALCVSNVPGPHDAVQVLGRPVLSLHSLAEIGKRHGLRVAVVSLGGRLFFGLLADPAIAEDLEAMAAGIEAEAEALGAAAT